MDAKGIHGSKVVFFVEWSDVRSAEDKLFREDIGVVVGVEAAFVVNDVFCFFDEGRGRERGWSRRG